MKTTKKPLISMRRVVTLLIFLIVLYVVVPQLDGFRQAASSLATAKPTWLGTALLATLMTYVCAAGMYMVLAQRPLRFGATLLVQLAGNFTNRVLPAGIGAIGVSYYYLRKQRHDTATAAAVVTANNTLGFMGNMLLMLLALAFSANNVQAVNTPTLPWWVWIVGLLVVLVAIIVLLNRRANQLRHGVAKLGRRLAYYWRHPVRLTSAIGISVLLTGGWAAVLFASAQAVGLHISLVTAFLIMSLGVLGGTVTPTPGGLVGAEAALLAGFVLYKADAATALAAVLLYRLFTYWFSLALGAAAFAIARQRRYI